MTATFRVDGRDVTAPEGMTLTAALLMAGIRVLSENPVSGRARGAFCGMGACFECELMVDGRIARACLTPVRNGLMVETTT